MKILGILYLKHFYLPAFSFIIFAMEGLEPIRDRNNN